MSATLGGDTTRRRTPRADADGQVKALTGEQREKAERRFVADVTKLLSQRKDLSNRFSQLKAEAVDKNLPVDALVIVAKRELEDADARMKRLQLEQDVAEARDRLGYQHQMDLGRGE